MDLSIFNGIFRLKYLSHSKKNAGVIEVFPGRGAPSPRNINPTFMLAPIPIQLSKKVVKRFAIVLTIEPILLHDRIFKGTYKRPSSNPSISVNKLEEF